MKTFKVILILMLMFFSAKGITQTYNIDTSFNVGNAGVGGGSVRAMIKQSDGKIVIAGSFTTYNGVSCKNMARLNSDGTLDTSFNVGTGLPNSSFVIRALEIDQDGKILAGGNFLSFNGVSRRCLVRLNTDGSVDTTFNGSNLISQINTFFDDRMIITIKVDANGKILIGGRFKVIYGTTTLYGFVRLNSNGAFDTTFNTTTNQLDEYSYGHDIKLQSNGKILVASLNQFKRPILRFNIDGSFDNSFLGQTFEGFGASILVLPDDKILLGGGVITTISGGSFRIMLKLNSDGSIDPSFAIYVADSGSSADNCVYTIKMQGDKILIGGNMTTYGGVLNNRMTRLNIDGTPDTTFNIGTGPNSTINSIDIDASNRILLCGSFISFNEVFGLRGFIRLGEGQLSLETNLDTGKVLFINNGKQYSFSSKFDNISSIYIYTIDGKKLQESHDINGLEYNLINSFRNGIKIIKVITSGGYIQVFKTID